MLTASAARKDMNQPRRPRKRPRNPETMTMIERCEINLTMLAELRQLTDTLRGQCQRASAKATTAGDFAQERYWDRRECELRKISDIACRILQDF